MGEILLRKAFYDYKTVFMPYRNFADGTREEYQNDLEGFIGFCELSGVKNAQSIGIPIIERYVAQLENEGFASQTRKKKVVAIRSLLTFLYQEGYIPSNLAKTVIVPLAENRAPHILTQRECDRLRQVSSGNKRDNAIIELILQTGIKLSELVRLTLDDIEMWESESAFIRVQGSRGKKERVIPLNTKATTALEKYLDEKTGGENGILFVNRFGETLGERGVQKMLRKYLRVAGIGRASIHTLRHTFGAHHIAKGTDPKTVQEVMGLKDVRSTSIYQTLAKEVVSRELQENSL
jgi:site-specific recombinase XerD